MLDPVLTQLVVKCKPESIPESLDVDVSELHVGDALHVDQLSLPDGVVAVGEPGRVVVSVLLGKGDAVDEEAECIAARSLSNFRTAPRKAWDESQAFLFYSLIPESRLCFNGQQFPQLFSPGNSSKRGP